MSEGKDVDNQEISWSVDGIAVHATLTLGAANGRRAAVAFVADQADEPRPDARIAVLCIDPAWTVLGNQTIQLEDFLIKRPSLIWLPKRLSI